MPLVSFVTVIARFCYHYPGVPYVSLAWPTRDHVIPWTRFMALFLELPDLVSDSPRLR